MNTVTDGLQHELDEICRRFAEGRLSAPIALMKLMIACESLAIVEAQVQRHDVLAQLLSSNRDGCARICTMLASGVDSSADAATVEAGLAFARRLFDWSVETSEESSVALYSLGNPELLAAATDEIVRLLEQWSLISPHHRCLQIGCGIGRIEAALGARVQEAHGIDISANMIAKARRRCASVPNTVFALTEGRDLSMFDGDRFELVYAVDSFPYLVQAGMELVETHFAEAARVLTTRGSFVLCNFSYREDLFRDRSDVRRLAEQHGFVVEIDGERPFRLWDGVAWRLRKRS